MLFSVSACKTKITVTRDEPNTGTPQGIPKNSFGVTENLGFIGGNIAAGGLMAGDGNGWVYYRSEADNWKLYKAKLDGTEKTMICADCPSWINVLDGWVYYSNYRDNFSIYRIRTDGTERHKLIDGYCCNLYVADSGIYFDMRDQNNSAQVYHMELDGSTPELLVVDMSVAAYYNGVIYCNSTSKLCTYDIQTHTLSDIYNKYTYNVSVDATGIYFWAPDEGLFYHMNYKSSQVNVLVKGGDFFNFTKGKLYYWGYGVNNCECIKCLNVKSGTTSVVLSLSDQYFDASGNLLGVTTAQVRDGKVKLDESNSDNDKDQFNGACETSEYTYVVEDRAFSRGVLRESLLNTGRLDCWILYNNGGGVVWD